jgi:C_GCAxxG_C_C family probable redox protein
VLLAVSQQLGIENPLIPRIATAFGGGPGRSGEVCGAVVGATMCIGIRYGRENSQESDAEANARAKQFVEEFRERMGSLRCRDLTGVDFSNAEQTEAYRASDVPMRVCLPAVGFAYDKTLELLEAQ